MSEYLIWLFIINITILSMHEIDAAYWKEWRLFSTLSKWRPFKYLDRIEEDKGISLFVFAHFPLFIMLLYTLVLIVREGNGWSSVLVSSLLIIHYIVHKIVNKMGRPEFTNSSSRLLLVASLIVSILQFGLSVGMIITIVN